MKGNWRLFKLTVASLAIIPVSREVHWISLPLTKTNQERFFNFSLNHQQNFKENYANQIRFFASKKGEIKNLSIPNVEMGKRGKNYYCLSTKKGTHFPSIIVQENGKEMEYRLPDWYQEWVKFNWSLNDELLPCWIEFGKTNGNYYAEFLDDQQNRLTPTSLKQEELIEQLKEEWLKALGKFK